MERPQPWGRNQSEHSPVHRQHTDKLDMHEVLTESAAVCPETGIRDYFLMRSDPLVMKTASAEQRVGGAAAAAQRTTCG